MKPGEAVGGMMLNCEKDYCKRRVSGTYEEENGKYTAYCGNHWEERFGTKNETPTLRDQFAMAALTGILSHPQSLNESLPCAKWCFEQAEAMLKAREAKP